MKPIIILFIATFASAAAFAQKSKADSQPKSNTVITTQYICPMHLDVTSDKPGKCSKCNMDLTLSKKERMKRGVVKLYTCPMHSEIVSKKAGICTKCSAKLIVDRRGSKQGTVVYTCSMHADVVSDKPGKCSDCGMDLMEAKTKSKTVKN